MNKILILESCFAALTHSLKISVPRNTKWINTASPRWVINCDHVQNIIYTHDLWRIALQADFIQIMKSLPVRVPDEDIEEMFAFADKDNDGKLSYAEFKVILSIRLTLRNWSPVSRSWSTPRPRPRSTSPASLSWVCPPSCSAPSPRAPSPPWPRPCWPPPGQGLSHDITCHNMS